MVNGMMTSQIRSHIIVLIL